MDKRLIEIRTALMKGAAPAVRELVSACLDKGIPPDRILEEGMVSAMAIIGERFKRDEIYMPEVMIAARAMNAGLEVLEPALVQSGAKPRGKVLQWTVAWPRPRREGASCWPRAIPYTPPAPWRRCGRCTDTLWRLGSMTRPHLPSIPHTAGVKDRCPRFPSDPFPPGGRGRQNVREVSMKRRIVLTTVFLGVLLIISGCAFVNVKTPFDTDLNETTLGSKRGTAEAYSLLWLFSWGDASYAAAAKNGGITVMRHADQELYQVFFGLYTRWRVIVYGD